MYRRCVGRLVASVQALVLSAQADELESFAAAKAKQVDLFDGLLKRALADYGAGLVDQERLATVKL